MAVRIEGTGSHEWGRATFGSSPGGESVLPNLLQRGSYCADTTRSTMFQICETGVQNGSGKPVCGECIRRVGGVGFMSTRGIAILGTGLLTV